MKKIEMLSETQKQVILYMCETNLSPMAVARKMNYSRGNIVHHIDKIKEKTGLNPMIFNDLLELKRMVEDE